MAISAFRVSVKKVFLKISQNSREKSLWQSLFFNIVAALRLLDSFQILPFYQMNVQ